MDETGERLVSVPPRLDREAVDQVLLACVEMQASDVKLQSNEPIIAKVHGRLLRITARVMSTIEVQDAISWIYGQNAVAELAKGADLDTGYSLRAGRALRYRFRVNATGCGGGAEGLQITLRVIPSEPPHIDVLGVEEEIRSACRPLNGLVLVTGATGQGKSTLLAAIIRWIASDPSTHSDILTYEAPIEFTYETVQRPHALIAQSEIPRHLPSFERGVRNALRRSPTAILVGESRDRETILAAVEASMTGHAVYSTVHASGVVKTVRRMLNVFPLSERASVAVDILDAMRLVVSQVLVESTDGKRVALREYLVFDEAVRDRLIEADVRDTPRVTRELLEQHGQPFAVDAQRKLDEGRISERTYRKVLQVHERTTREYEHHVLA